MTKVVAEHVEHMTFSEEKVIAAHDDRSENVSLFHKSKKQLEEDGHITCFICGTSEDIETHHYGCEKADENNCDFEELKAYLLCNDVYGYSHKMIDIPLTSVDDIRNQMQLCTVHHRGKCTGAHCTTHGTWIMQKIGKANPVKQPGETIEQVQERVV
ncbi:MAG: hypothetical protein H6Q72_973 [Firmicutes bacterium]|nr:hypothetical protein [Bacillota bacterium]